VRIARIARRIEEDWERLRVEVERVLEDGRDVVGLDRMLEIQSGLLYSFQRLSLALRLAGTALAEGGTPEAELFPFEYFGALRQLARLRALAQRLNKDHLLYRLRIDEGHRLAPVIDVATQIDRALHQLRNGDVLSVVPLPPTPEIEEQLAELEREWIPIRRLAQASPFDYLRGDLFRGRPTWKSDPLSLRYFDRQVEGFGQSVERTSRMYLAECRRGGYAFACERRLILGRASMLSEMMVREAVLEFAEIESDGSLEQSREAFEQLLAAPTGWPDLDLAIENARGPESQRARAVLDEIRRTWIALRREFDLAMQGSAEPANLRRAIELQRLLAPELDRLDIAAGRVDLFELGDETSLPVVSVSPDDGN
jgi:hypothetical protein